MTVALVTTHKQEKKIEAREPRKRITKDQKEWWLTNKRHKKPRRGYMRD